MGVESTYSELEVSLWLLRKLGEALNTRHICSVLNDTRCKRLKILSKDENVDYKKQQRVIVRGVQVRYCEQTQAGNVFQQSNSAAMALIPV